MKRESYSWHANKQLVLRHLTGLTVTQDIREVLCTRLGKVPGLYGACVSGLRAPPSTRVSSVCGLRGWEDPYSYPVI